MFFIRIGLLFFCCFSASVGATQQGLEYKVKAAYLYNFTKFITWPKKQTDSFNICILEPDPFAELLDPLEKRTVSRKPIRLHRVNSIQQATHCHILYLDQKASDRLLEVKSLLSGVLIITSLEGESIPSNQPFFAKHGGLIAFVIRDGRIKLQVNLAALKKNGFKISAKLLEIAEIVKGIDNE